MITTDSQKLFDLLPTNLKEHLKLSRYIIKSLHSGYRITMPFSLVFGAPTFLEMVKLTCQMEEKNEFKLKDGVDSIEQETYSDDVDENVYIGDWDSSSPRPILLKRSIEIKEVIKRPGDLGRIARLNWQPGDIAFRFYQRGFRMRFSITPGPIQGVDHPFYDEGKTGTSWLAIHDTNGWSGGLNDADEEEYRCGHMLYDFALRYQIYLDSKLKKMIEKKLARK